MKKIIILSIIACSILFFVPEKMYKEIFRACLETHLSIMKRFNSMLAMAI